MKRLLLVSLMILIASPAAAFVDTLGQWEMETIVAGSPQDSIADVGGNGNDLLLGTMDGDPPALVSGTSPTLTPGAAGAGNALLFDGDGDAATAYGVWANPVDNIVIEYSMNAGSVPNVNGDNYMGLVGVMSAQTYWQDDYSGNGTGRVLGMAFQNNGNLPPTYLVGTTGLALDAWHDVKLEITNTGGNGYGEMILTVDGDVNSISLPSPLANDDGTEENFWASPAQLGRMVYMPARYFDGALDNVMIAADVPEPSSLTLIGLAGLALMIMRRRK